MSRVIRGGGGDGDGPRVVPGEVYDARAEAERLTAEARAGAERLTAEARAEAERIAAEAERQGRQAGRAESAELLARAAGERDRALAQAEREVVKLALAAAERIVGEQIALEPERVQRIVRDVIARARRASRLTVRVHPDDVPAVRALEHEVHSLSVEPDPEVARGGCVVRSDVGELDARLEVQLEALERALLGDGG